MTAPRPEYSPALRAAMRRQWAYTILSLPYIALLLLLAFASWLAGNIGDALGSAGWRCWWWVEERQTAWLDRRLAFARKALVEAGEAKP